MNKTSIQFVKQAIASLRSQRRSIDKQIEILEKALTDLQAVVAEKPDMSTVQPVSTSIPRRAGRTGHNVEIISSILEQGGKPLTVKTIAHMAYESGQITSANKYTGVYNIVQTVLKRNQKSTFVKVDRGTWDLKSRRREAVHISGERRPVLAK